MTESNADPGTESLPDYHELNSTRQNERYRGQQYGKDAFELDNGARNYYLGYLFFSYAAIALSSWVILCKIGRGPIEGKGEHYGELQPFRDPKNGQRDLKTASILASIAAVLALPTAASVCSYAAVPFAQYHARGQKLTLKQTLALANQDWMSPLIVPTFLLPARNRMYGSHFLWFASFVTILGLVIWPVQQAFLKPLATVKASEGSNYGYHSTKLTDIPQLFATSDTGVYTNLEVIQLRKALESWSGQDCNPRFWWGNASEDMLEWHQACAHSQGSSYLSEFPRLFEEPRSYSSREHPKDLFVAQLPYGFNTGFERNYIPRFNTSVQYDNITESEVPDGCFSEDESTDLIKYRYDYDGDYGIQYYVQTCMSSSALEIPLKNGTRDRQDFDEVFYMNISIFNWRQDKSTIFRVSARTTVGYFELPNYYNNGTQGPLLETFTLPDGIEVDDRYPNDQNRGRSYGEQQPQFLEQVENKGPLANIYAALFGNGSFISSLSSPDYLAYLNSTTGNRQPSSQNTHEVVCEARVPLGSMIESYGSNYDTSVNACIRPASTTADLQGVAGAGWLSNFLLMTDEMGSALGLAAALADEVLLANPGRTGGLPLQVDRGVDVLAPVMPAAGVIVGSALLGLFLAALAALVLFAWCVPRWTARLNAAAALQMGAAMALSTDGLALRDADGVCDRAPGFVGDAMCENEVGRLAVGAERSVARKRRYEASLCAVMQG